MGVLPRLRRSTKAGGYPRLRGHLFDLLVTTLISAQRRPEVIPGYEAHAHPRSNLHGAGDAQRRPEVIPGYECPLLVPPRISLRTLNEGRRLSPATRDTVPRHRGWLRPLNEGRRLSPATSSTSCRSKSGRRSPNEGRRLSPATSPGAGEAGRRVGGALNEGRRLSPATSGVTYRARRAAVRRPLNEGRRLSPATSPGRPRRPTAPRRRAQRRPEVIPGYERRSGLGVVVHRPHRSTKAGGYPRLRAGCSRWWISLGITPLNEGRRLSPATRSRVVLRRSSPTPPLNEGRRLSPATSGPAARLRGPTAARSTKAGGYPRLRGGERPQRLRTGCSPLNEGRRLSPATRRSPRPPGRWRSPLNEGRRLSPATRPGVVPPARPGQPRSTKAGGYPRLRADPDPYPDERHLPRSTKAGGYPRLRGLRRATQSKSRSLRSTKAGGYPRLRVEDALKSFARSLAQRRPEVIPGYEGRPAGPGRPCGPRSTKAGGYPRLRGSRPVREDGGHIPRSTKAGGYPRLRAAPDACAPGNARLHAQRRPEVIPGYECLARPRDAAIGSAQRRPEVIPGYELAALRESRDGAAPERSTKAGGYPRLRAVFHAYRNFRLELRSTKAGGYPRLRVLRQAGITALRQFAQRRPEVIPGYEVGRKVKEELIEFPLNEGRRLSPATRVNRASHSTVAVPRAQRRPEVIPGYEVAEAPGACRGRIRSTKAGGYPRLRVTRLIPYAAGDTAQRRPEVIPGYESKVAQLKDGDNRPRSTKAGGYPRLRGRVLRIEFRSVGPRSTKAGGYPRLRGPGWPPRRGQSRPPLNEGRRLSPATSGAVGATGAGYRPLNEGRRLSPATSASARASRSATSTRAQRRPEVIPGYEVVAFLGQGFALLRSTKAGGYPRLRGQESPDGQAIPGAALNEGRRLSPATRQAFRSSSLVPWIVAQRRPEVIPGYECFRSSSSMGRRSGAQRRPEVIPGYEHRRRVGGQRPRRRSTKAGGYPRLRGGSRRFRRGIRCGTLNEGRRLSPATRRRPATGGWAGTGTLNEGRRLSPATSTRPRADPPRTESALNEGRRLSPATRSSVLHEVGPDPNNAQRRPEVIPGYESLGGRAARNSPLALNEGRRLSPATSRTCSR